MILIQRKEAIKNHIQPLIDKQITDINKTNISDNHVDNARKMQLRCIIVCKIIMIRVDTIKTSEKLAQIDVDRLPKEEKIYQKWINRSKENLKIKESVN